MFRQVTASFTTLVFFIFGMNYAMHCNAGEIVGDVKAQVVISSNGDSSKFLGSWHTCSRMPSGNFYGNTIQFLRDDNGLVFLGNSGLVGEYRDSACSKGVPSRVRAISAIKRLVKMIETKKLESGPRPHFIGEADEMISPENATLTYVGFSTDFKCIFLSPSLDFKGDVLRYDK